LTTPQWGFSGPMETNDETNDTNEHNMVKIPTGRRQTSLLFTNVVKELNYCLLRNNSM